MGAIMRKKVRRKSKGLKVIFFLTIFICGIIFYKKNSLDIESAKYKKQIGELEKKIEKEEKRSEEIKNYQEYVETKEYIEEVARERLGLVYKDEIIFKAEEK